MDTKLRQRGATLLEVALGAGVFLALFFMLFWWNASLNIRWHLNAAANESLRLAYARAHSLNPSSNLFGWGNGGATADTATLQPLLTGGNQTALTANEALQKSFSDVALNINNISPVYVAALVYANEQMRIGVNPAMNYPCDPSTGASACFLCQFYTDQTYVNLVTPSQAATLPQVMFMRCRYRVDAFLIDPLIGALRAAKAYGSGGSGPIIYEQRGAYALPGDLDINP